jgi:hypothetical protein
MLRFVYRPPREKLGAPLPQVGVVMRGPSQSRPIDPCLVDSGADHNIFNDTWAQVLGIDLSLRSDTYEVTLPQYGNITGRMVKVKYILDNYEWVGETVFIEWSTPVALLGRVGFFDAFDVKFAQSGNQFFLYPTKAKQIDLLKQ